MTARIRRLRRDDLPQLTELCREHAAYERSKWVEDGQAERLARLLLSPLARARCWVAEGEGELAGFATAAREFATWEAAQFVHMDCLYLRDRYRGSGLGRRLMEHIVDYAIECDAINLQWQTPAWNEGAIRFYGRLGATAKDKQRFTLDRTRFDSLRSPSSKASPAPREGEDAWHPRVVVPLGTLEQEPWRAKVYGIETGEQDLAAPTMRAAMALATRELEAIARHDATHQGLAFVTVHEGTEARWLLIDAWLSGGKLTHDIYRAAHENPEHFEHSPQRGPQVCVWELAVLEFERQAWLEHMYHPDRAPDPDAYLDCRYRGVC